MKIFEYMTLENDSDSKDFIETLNKLGEQGWEFIGPIELRYYHRHSERTTTDTTTTDTPFVLKRELMTVCRIY